MRWGLAIEASTPGRKGLIYVVKESHMEGPNSMDANRTSSSTSPISLDVIPLHSTNLLTVLEANGTIHYESPSITRIFGFEPDDLVGHDVAEYFHPDDRDRVLASFHQLVNNDDGMVEAVEYRHQRADGSYTWVESVGSATTTPDGHYVINTREITEQKARERNLTMTNERLNEFAQIVSHDLQNPLSVANGYLELAIEEGTPEHLERVRTAHDRMEELIDDLLVLARQGDVIGELAPVDLASVIETSWDNVDTGDATLDADIDRDIVADESRLRQLLENLFRNAIEHGGADVTVTVGDLPGGFFVEDTGVGVPDQPPDELFEVGFSTADGGTGFGLGIVEHIATAHGWDIHLAHGETDGARFEITGVEWHQAES